MILWDTGQLKRRRRLEHENTRSVIVGDFERGLSWYGRIVDKLQDLLELVRVVFSQLHQDVEELEEKVMPGQVRDEDVGGACVGLVSTEAEPELGVRAGQDERVGLHGFAGKREV